MSDLVKFLWSGIVPESRAARELRMLRMEVAQAGLMQVSAGPPSSSPGLAALALPIPPPGGGLSPLAPASERSKTVMVMTWAMTVIGLVDLVGVIVLVAIGKDVPDFLQLILSSIIGYFGGAISAYMGVR